MSFTEFNALDKSLLRVTCTSTLLPAIEIIPMEFSGFFSHFDSAIKLAASAWESHLDG